MPETQLPKVAEKAALLLIEPDPTRSSERTMQLKEADYCVTRAEGPRDLSRMRDVFDFSVVVLSDEIGLLSLQTSAQMVRGQWPKAHIVILGQAPKQFEDQLYDVSVAHAAQGDRFLEVLRKVREEACGEKGDEAFAAWLLRVNRAARSKQSGAVQESDPKKASGSVRGADHPRERPGHDRLRQGAR